MTLFTCITHRITFALLSCALTFSFAQDKMMAIVDVQLQGEAKNYFSVDEKQYLSTAIRAQASKVLGSQVEILSQAKYKALVKGNSEGCSEAGCFAGFIKEIGVDLGMQPTVSHAFGKLKMTLEVADSKTTLASRTLSFEANEAGKNKLGEDVDAEARELFTEVAARLGLAHDPTGRGSNATVLPPDMVLDPRDGQKYKTVRIGRSQVWMAQNMDFETGNSWCYDNNSNSCAKYGRLYDWQSAMKACPSGWHLPSDEEWKTLEESAGIFSIHNTGWRGAPVGKKLKSRSGWNFEGNGSDELGLSALPGGRLEGTTFRDLGGYGYWWSSTLDEKSQAWVRGLEYGSANMNRGSVEKSLGYSVRCIQDVK